MAVYTIDPFDAQMPFPLDLRYRKADLNGRNSIPSNSRYPGMLCWTDNERVVWVLDVGSGGDPADNTNWKQLYPAAGGATQNITWSANAPTTQGSNGDIWFRDNADTGNVDLYFKAGGSWGLLGSWSKESDELYVNIENFGAIGDGVTNNYAAITDALDVAKSEGKKLYFPTGKYFMEVPVNSINMNGCRGIIGEGEILVSTETDPEDAVFLWDGQKQQIAGPIAISHGQNSFTFPTGLSLVKGDTVFAVSNEKMFADIVSPNYTKGVRYTVDTYDSTTGEVIFDEYSLYDITNGYFHLNTVKEIVAIEGVKITLVTPNNPYKKGIQVNVGELYIQNASIIGFARFCVCSSSSLTRIDNSNIQTLYDFTGSQPTAYAVQSAGLSDVKITSSNLFSGRHALSSGDVGYWKVNNAGGATTDNMFLPSIAKVINSTITGFEHAVDSHSGTTIMDLFNTDIYGGTQLGGLSSTLNFCRIYEDPDAIRLPLSIGRGERDPSFGVYASEYRISNCDFYVKERFMRISANIERLSLANNKIHVKPSASPTRDLVIYSTSSTVKNLEIDGIEVVAVSGDNPKFTFRPETDTRFKNIHMVNGTIDISVRNDNVDQILFQNVKLYGESGSAIFIGSLIGANRQFNVGMIDSFISGYDIGIEVTRAKTVKLSESSFVNNGQSVIFNNNSAGTITGSVTNSRFDQPSGDVIGVINNQETYLTLINNTFDVSGIVNVPQPVVLSLNNSGAVISNGVVTEISDLGIVTSANVNELPSQTFNVDFGGTISPGNAIIQTVNIPGALPGDVVVVGIGSSTPGQFVINARVGNSSGDISLFGLNTDISDITVNSITVKVKVFK